MKSDRRALLGAMTGMAALAPFLTLESERATGSKNPLDHGRLLSLA